MKVSCTTLSNSESVLSRTLAALLSANGVEAEPFVMDSGEARRISSVHEGVTDLGVGLSTFVRWGYRDEGAYDGWRQTSLRALATLTTPTWFTIAAREDLGLTTVGQFAERISELGILCYPPDGHSAGWVHITDALLAPYGTSLREMRDHGRLIDIAGYDGSQDPGVVILPHGGPGIELSAWTRTITVSGLRAIDLGEDGERVAKRFDLRLRRLPSGGVLQPADSRGLYFPRMVVFGSERMHDDVAAQITRLLITRRDELWAEGFGLDPTVALDPTIGIPYHRAAIAQYRESGLMPEAA